MGPTQAAGASVQQVVIPSFDGTLLSATLFTPAGADSFHRVPYVLMTHGWAGSRVADLSGRVASLVDAGYGVLTWDSRGFGQSGGEVMLDSPDYEVKDVSTLITWLTGHAPVAYAEGDPVIGMSGGSYAGGIQLLSAAFDGRIDAIAPEITWNDLAQSLGPNGVPKLYWTSLLFGAGQATSCAVGLDPRENGVEPGCQTSLLAQWYARVHATNSIPEDVRAELIKRSPATYMDDITIPTLLVQGFPDTLFDVNQAVANYEGIKANGAPVKLWIYDGGHAGPGTQGGLIGGVVLDWFACHLSLTPDCADVGPEVEYYTSDGEWRSASSWPIPDLDAMTRHVNGLPPMPMALAPTGDQGKANIVLETAATGERRVATGNVHLAFDVSATAPETTLFASLGVRHGGVITRVGDQTQPVRVATPIGQLVHVELGLVDVSAAIADGDALVLTLATQDTNYDGSRAPGYVYVENIDVAWRSG